MPKQVVFWRCLALFQSRLRCGSHGGYAVRHLVESVYIALPVISIWDFLLEGVFLVEQDLALSKYRNNTQMKDSDICCFQAVSSGTRPDPNGGPRVFLYRRTVNCDLTKWTHSGSQQKYPSHGLIILVSNFETATVTRLNEDGHATNIVGHY